MHKVRQWECCSPPSSVRPQQERESSSEVPGHRLYRDGHHLKPRPWLATACNSAPPTGWTENRRHKQIEPQSLMSIGSGRKRRNPKRHGKAGASHMLLCKLRKHSPHSYGNLTTGPVAMVTWPQFLFTGNPLCCGNDSLSVAFKYME